MKESQLQTAIENLLKVFEKRGDLIFIKNNTGAFKPEHGGFVRFGKKGSSDFLIFMKDKTYFVECKSAQGRQSDSQKDFQRRVEKLGSNYQYLIARDVAAVYELLKVNQ